jgi:serine/threonine protein kinase
MRDDEQATAAFDRVDNAYDEIVVDAHPETRQPVSSLRQRRREARGSRCHFAFAPGTCIDKYEVGEPLGQGTFGMVRIARDTELDRPVALKILNPSHRDSSDILRRFLQEGRAAARVRHPGITMVLDSGTHQLPNGDDIAFVAMELLEGESLTKRLLRAGRLAPGTAAEIARQIASALEAAHRAGVVHRDLKPDNIYLVPDSAVATGERVKVLDFGLAKFVDVSTTALGTVFGTPRYMSPEQCRSSTMLDHRSDIYALGCMLFELVTGRTPFEGELYKIVDSHLRVAPPPARALAPEVSPALDDLIARMLAKDPSERPESMAAVEAELRLAGAANTGSAATLGPEDWKRLVRDESVLLLDRLKPTTDLPTPTHVVIHPLPRRGSWVPLVALVIAFAIAVVVTALSVS